MTKFEEEVKRPDNGPITELNNSMHSVLSQYRKMREYADYLEYELKQKDEHILKLENENSFMRDEHTTFDSNGMAVEPKLQHQALPVVPEFVAEWYEEEKDSLEFAVYDINTSIHRKSLNDRTKIEKWFARADNKPIETVFKMKDGYTIEKPQLFYLRDELTGQFLTKNNQFKNEDRYFFWNGEDPLTHSIGTAWKLTFTQQEIDSMQTGSYEQIPMPVEDGE